MCRIMSHDHCTVRRRQLLTIVTHVMVQIAHINGFIFSVLGSVKNLLVNGIVVIASILIDLTSFAIIV